LNSVTKKFIKAKIFRTSSTCYFKGLIQKFLEWMAINLKNIGIAKLRKVQDSWK
jgi:hypothetical protein